jgi:hypothetical protein
MRTEALEALRSMPSPVMEQVRRLLERFETEVVTLCRNHAETQRRSLNEMGQIVSDLSALYEHLDLAQNAALPVENHPS